MNVAPMISVDECDDECWWLLVLGIMEKYMMTLLLLVIYKFK